MFQYDLYQRKQIEVCDSVFYYGMCGHMPIVTVKEKYVHQHQVAYYVLYDNSPSVRFNWSVTPERTANAGSSFTRRKRTIT